MCASDFGIIFRTKGIHNEENCRSLGVANIMQVFLLGLFQHIVDHLWHVNRTHLVPGELPELPLMRFHSDVTATVRVPSTISHPNVVASVGEEIGETLFWTGDYKVGRRAYDAVLKVDRRILRWTRIGNTFLRMFSVWNSVQSQVVAIAGDHKVFFSWVAMSEDEVSLK